MPRRLLRERAGPHHAVVQADTSGFYAEWLAQKLREHDAKARAKGHVATEASEPAWLREAAAMLK